MKQLRIGLPKAVHELVMKNLSEQPWIEVNHVIQAVHQTAMPIDVEIPDTQPAAAPATPPADTASAAGESEQKE